MSNTENKVQTENFRYKHMIIVWITCDNSIFDICCLDNTNYTIYPLVMKIFGKIPFVRFLTLSDIFDCNERKLSNVAQKTLAYCYRDK